MVRIRHQTARARRAIRVRPVSRGRLRLLLIGWAVVVLGATSSVAFASVPGEPTITFTNSGSPPTACNTAPDLSALMVPARTEIILVNRTLVTVTVYVGAKAGVMLADGQGVGLTLKVGQHDVTMHPDCKIIGSTRPLVVTVLEAGTPTPTASTSTGSTGSTGPGGTGSTGSPTRSSAAEPPRPGQGSGDQASPDAGSGDGGTATTGSPAGALGSASAASSDPTVGIDADAGTFDVPFDVKHPENGRGVRLLAVIATICVLGVTAGIIRAILAQRADSVVNT